MFINMVSFDTSWWFYFNELVNCVYLWRPKYKPFLSCVYNADAQSVNAFVPFEMY